MISDSMRVSDLLAQQQLHAVFQPVVDFSKGEITSYEGLLRGPEGSPLESATALFMQARAEGLSNALEYAAARICMTAFAALGYDAKLAINFSADALYDLGASRDPFRFLDQYGIDRSRIVVELTEQYPIRDLNLLARIVATLQDRGIQFALDDYGIAHESMSLWVGLRPDYVKIDRSFIHDIAQDPLKFEAVRSMQHFAKASGTRLLAEGIENQTDLSIVRDMGIDYGQGFLLGRPSQRPARAPAQRMRGTIRAMPIAMFPDAPKLTAALDAHGALARMLVAAPALSPRATNHDVLELFNRMPDLHAVAVVDGERPVALINHRTFMDRYARPYHPELFGRKSCLQFASTSPVVLEKNTRFEQLAELLAGQDQRYLVDGFIIVENGRYLGLGTGHNLVRAVTETRLQAARYANPLTFLPGNIPIGLHIDRLLESASCFHACYVDLNHFKPFNDQYGYWLGDEVLKFAASVLTDAHDPACDFLGHVGGDDFLILFQSDDWQRRVLQAIERFNAGVARFYAAPDRQAGGIHGQDRHGQPAFFGFVTMAIGCVAITLENMRGMRGSESIASLAAVAKQRAKQQASGYALIDARFADAEAGLEVG